MATKSKTTRTVKSKSIDLSTLQHFEFFIAGVVHHANLAFLDLSPGDTLNLVPEPENIYDRDAIAIYDGLDKLGFVPGPRNAQGFPHLLSDLHRMAKTGHAFRCVVRNFAPTNPTHRMILVRIYTLPPEPTVAHNALASF